MSISKSPNINYLWSNLLIEEFVRNGLDYCCISPGSRSAPLTVAAALNPKMKTFVHFDERGEGFHALGYSSATGKPSIVITTSGSALGNLFPAIIEASKKKIPLIILTADRPPELRFTGANQTIDQVKIFGDYVRWSFDMPTPTQDIPAEFILTTVDQAIHRSMGELKGPVHLNCMFREPLEPSPSKENFTRYLKHIQTWQKSKKVYTHYTTANPTLSNDDLLNVTSQINAIKRGIIVVGKIAKKDRLSVLKLSEKLGWPIFPDITSGLRVGIDHKNIIPYFDQILLSTSAKKQITCDGVLHLGGRITSKRWYQFVEQKSPKQYIMVLNHPLRNDPLHNVTMRLQAPVGKLCDSICTKLKKKKKPTLLSNLQKLSQSISFKPSIPRLISQLIPKDTGLFLSSSLPIREMDMFADHKGEETMIGSNRGASGIDGTIASACGFSQGLNKRVTLLIGDLAFLYDLNSLAMLKDLKNPMTIIVVNNNGGGIFRNLPISEYKDVFEQYFITPHNLQFDSTAHLFNLDHVLITDIKALTKNYPKSFEKKTSTIFEIKTP